VATRPVSSRQTFKTKTNCLSGEQSYCAVARGMVRPCFDVWVEAGYPPEMALLRGAARAQLIVDLMYRGGIARMNSSGVSRTAEFGVSVGAASDRRRAKERMRDLRPS